MSKLIVEVCRVDKVEKHPNADRLAVATVKGWKTAVPFNPETGAAVFQEGEKCVFFPPDSVLPLALIDRLGIRNYLHQLPKNEKGERSDAMRVIAARLRGESSYGTIMKLDAAQGDNPDWEIGLDVADHYGVTKFEPPMVFSEGLAEPDHSRFYRYTDIENFANYPTAIPDGTEVVYTEKLHGKNCRVGLVLDEDENGQASWNYMAGSHDVRRRELYRTENRYRVSDLIESGVVKENETIDVGDVFLHNGRYWQVDDIKYKPIEGFFKKLVTYFFPKLVKPEAEKVQVFQVNKIYPFELPPGTVGWETVWTGSEFWQPLNEPGVKTMLEYVRDSEWPEAKFSIMLYGELFGSSSGQDMHYGINGYGFRVFDISVNNKYLDFDLKKKLCDMFNITMVPILYRGPFSVQTLEEFTSGPTTMCEPDKAGNFKGREGVVATPVVEVHYCPVLNGRRIVKSVSADYHARKGGTEFH